MRHKLEMNKRRAQPVRSVNLEAAEVLLRTTLDFLAREGLGSADIAGILAKVRRGGRRGTTRTRQFRLIVKAYEEMGVVLSTWFTNPRFLDRAGQPLPLRLNPGENSFDSLVRASRVEITTELALALLSKSPSARVDALGRVTAVKRAFVLADFEIPRATLIIERFLDTLRRNGNAQSGELPLLLERCCYVTGIGAPNIAQIMRDIKAQGAAFMDSVDGEIEAHRVRKSSRFASGEMGVVAFAWTQQTRNLGKPRRGRI